MEVKADFVRAARQERGWTQQHLAEACDISLRTIQRVEKLGVASPETLLSLSAVFEKPHTELLAEPARRMVSGKMVLSALALLVAFAAGLLLGKGMG